MKSNLVSSETAKLFVEAALAAGREIKSVASGSVNVAFKSDSSPVTAADERAEAIICSMLARSWPGVAIVAEERFDGSAIRDQHLEPFFLVDPLDGTKEFISRSSDYTVNIALIVDSSPVLGVVAAPAKNKVYVGSAGVGAYVLQYNDNGSLNGEHKIAVCRSNRPLIAVASKSHRSPETEEYLTALDISEFLPVGSSLKFCSVAEGSADIYPRLGRTMQWDTAAGDAVLRAAGGGTVRLDGTPLSYGMSQRDGLVDFSNPHFVALGNTNMLSNLL